MPRFQQSPVPIPIVVALTALLANMSFPALGEPAGDTSGGPAVDVLKQEYLVCERAALAGKLGAGDIMHCSSLYEELKLRAFDGEFRKLREWYEAQQPGPAIGGLLVETLRSAAVT